MGFLKPKIGFGSIFPVWEIPIKYQSKPINSPFFPFLGIVKSSLCLQVREAAWKFFCWMMNEGEMMSIVQGVRDFFDTWRQRIKSEQLLWKSIIQGALEVYARRVVESKWSWKTTPFQSSLTSSFPRRSWKLHTHYFTAERRKFLQFFALQEVCMSCLETRMDMQGCCFQI